MIQKAKIIIITGSVLLLFACESKKAGPQGPMTVPVVAVLQKDIPFEVEFVGQTYGESDIAIRARVEGFLEGFHFEEGGRVEKGDLLYSIDQEPFLAKVAGAQSKVVEAQTTLVRAESDLRRIRPLAERKAVSESDLDAAVAEQGAAQASVEAAKAELRFSRINLGYTKIYAPIGGLIGKTEARVGDFVGREPNPVVLNMVSKISNIRVQFSLPEAYYLGLVKFYGSETHPERDDDEKAVVEIVLADGTLFEHKGSVDFIDRQVDPTTGSLLVQATFPNPEYVLRPGQFGRVKVILDEVKGGLLIPQRCVREIQGIYEIFTVDAENKVHNKQVKMGPRIGNMWAVLDGLEKDERVLLEGLQWVRSGMTIKPELQEFEFISSN